jgi:hypothetical protein
MKNKVSFFMAAFLLAFGGNLFSQDVCNSSYMPFDKGASFELTNYDKKGKLNSTVSHKITDLKEADGGFVASVEMETKDQKGKSLTNGKYTMECRDDKVSVDVSSMMNAESMAGFSNMEVEMSGNALEFPNRLDPGTTLPDASMVMKAKSGGMSLFSMTMNITERKVEGTETITTPAGTFDCVKMSQSSEMKAIMKKKFKSTAWYAKGVGMVKSENYDDKGKLESSTVLTKFER